MAALSGSYAFAYYVEHDKEKETQFDRTSVAKVYEQIVKDLKEAVRCFTESPQTKMCIRDRGKQGKNSYKFDLQSYEEKL